MTKESICAKCAELIRIKVSNYGRGTSGEEIRICPLKGIGEVIVFDDTIEECSRFVKVPEDKLKAKEEKHG